MENGLNRLSLEPSGQKPLPLPTRTLASNVYKVRTNEKVIVYKYNVKAERIQNTENGTKKIAIKMNGADAIRLIRSRVTREALLVISRKDIYKETTIIYDGHDCLYASESITDSTITEEISIQSMNLADEDKRIVLRDSTKVTITITADEGLSNIPEMIKECDREEPNLINFYSSLLKSSAPHEQFIGLRGGRLFDLSTFRELGGTGMLRCKGVKIGTKLIGSEQLSVAIDIDSKDGTFFKPQPLIDSICQHFKCSTQQLQSNYGDVQAMIKMERYIRDTAVREETSDRVFSIAGLKWGESDGKKEEKEKYLMDWTQLCNNEKQEHYGRVPVVVEEYVTGGEKKTINYTHHPLTALHVLPYSKVPLFKQDKLNRPPCLDPNERYKMINKARNYIKIDIQNDNLRGFGTEVATKPVCPLSEIIPAPKISAMKNGTLSQITTDRTKHSFNPDPFGFVEPAKIDSIHIVYDTNEVNEEKARRFANVLFEVCVAKGMTALRSNYHGVRWEYELDDYLTSLVSTRKNESKNGVVPVYVVVCLGFKNCHDLLKYLMHKYLITVQHVMSATVVKVIKNTNIQTLHGIARKLNEKCGGSNVEVTPPNECGKVFPPRIADANAPISLIIGMDVCHGDPLSKHHENRGIKPDPSIIGISSNALTRNLQMFTGDIIPTQGRRESVPDDVMAEHGRYLVKKFLENHLRLPDNVILVRDGVARSQYEMAKGEFAALVEGVRKGADSTDFSPREVLIICTKEHNLRLFDKVNNMVKNPVPGTVVDSDIVSPFLPEFLIIPQDAFKGTAKGVLVTILKDGEKGLKNYPRESLNEMKYFIHSLCFLHTISALPSGCPEPVSVSHDLAERGMMLAKERRWRTGERLSVEELKRELTTRGTLFEGIKFTA